MPEIWNEVDFLKSKFLQVQSLAIAKNCLAINSRLGSASIQVLIFYTETISKMFKCLAIDIAQRIYTFSYSRQSQVYRLDFTYAPLAIFCNDEILRGHVGTSETKKAAEKSSNGRVIIIGNSV
jgi:hypothetical protein